MNQCLHARTSRALIAAMTLTLAAAARAQSVVRINEVLANNVTLTNAGRISDWVEFHNPSTTTVDLTDTSLSDNPTTPRRFVFAAGTGIPPGGYLVIQLDPQLPRTASNAGFGLKAGGDQLYFFDTRASGSRLIDSVSFGIQAPDLSIGRLPGQGTNWALARPTPGGPNVASPLASPEHLKINEWMADRSNGRSDWFEIFNAAESPVALGGLFLTDNLRVPGRHVIPPLSFIGTGPRGAYTLFHADNQPENGADHVNFQLASGGEAIGIYATGFGPIDTITFGSQQVNVSEGRLPDGAEDRAFFPESPSPGAPNRFLEALTDVVINEVLAHTDPPLEDAVELLNLTDAPIDIGGWYLSDDVNDLTRYRIPNGTILPANGFVVIYEGQFNAAGRTNPTVPFTYNSARGDEAFLSRPDESGTPVAFVRQAFASSQNGVSFGRHVTSEGVDFVAMSRRSFGRDNPRSLPEFRRGTGLPNPAPLVGPLVINEIMYHPPDIGVSDNHQDEFIELRNITTQRLPLFDRRYPTNRWRLRDAVGFEFPANTWVDPGGILLVVKFDPATNAAQLAAFRFKYLVEPSVPVFGPYSGELANDEDSVELVRPDPVQLPPHPDAGYVPYILVDRVRYEDAASWPAEADGAGFSLQRRNRRLYGNDPVNWFAGAPSAGRPNGSPPVITLQPQSQIYLAGADITFTAAATGSEPLGFQWRLDGADIPGATNSTLALLDPGPAGLGTYTVAVGNDEEAVVSAPAVLRADLKKPALRVNTPKANLRVTNATLLVEGTVRDDFGVSQVLVSLNEGDFEPVQGSNSFSTLLTLAPGTNLVRVKAVDFGLNESPTIALRVFLAVPAVLTVRSCGNGTGFLKPDLHGAILEIGRGYSINAAAVPGSLFSNWVATSASGSFIGTGPGLNFLMQSNLVLEANFVANPFPAVGGAYHGLFFEQDEIRHHRSGFVALAITDQGVFSGSLHTGGRRQPFTGRFDLSGLATNRIAWSSTNSVALELRLDWNGGGQIIGRIIGHDWSAELAADRSVYSARDNPSPFNGAHTLVIKGAIDTASEPAGDGYATASVDPGGRVTFAGVLGDGTKASQKVPLSRSGAWPLYAGLYGGKGSILGWITFTNLAGEDLGGRVSWTKLALPGKHYPDGFTNDFPLTGSRYAPPGTGRVLSLTNALLVLSGGNLGATITNRITLDERNQFVPSVPGKVAVRLSSGSGILSGTVTDPGSANPISFKAVVLQKQNLAAGHFLGTNQSGRVILAP